MFDHLRLLRDRLPEAEALKTWLAGQCVRRLQPEGGLSYSQRGEDRAIEFYLEVYLGKKMRGRIDHLDSGFYVDVGCYDPVHLSNTFTLYKKGWHGINIDANRDVIDLFCERRPRDINVQAALSDERERIKFYEFANRGLSSFDEEHVEKWKERNQVVDEYELETIPLTEVLSEHNAPEQFDLLDVDVEGFDLRVLRSLDLNQYRPRLILVEVHDTSATEIQDHPIVRYLQDHNYTLEGYAVQTGFFLDRAEVRK
jgi:FkbM family methyltransferase